MRCRLFARRRASPVHHDNRLESVVSAGVIRENRLVERKMARGSLAASLAVKTVTYRLGVVAGSLVHHHRHRIRHLSRAHRFAWLGVISVRGWAAAIEVCSGSRGVP
jgi:hypothetical protein